MEQYSLGRVYAADLAASGITLIGSWVLFKERFITLLGVGNRMAREIAQESAAQHFVFGKSLGKAWYGMFPPEPSATDLILAALLLGCILTLFSFIVGVVSEPLRYGLGLHQKNLQLFLDRLDERLRLHLAKELRHALESQGSSDLSPR